MQLHNFLLHGRALMPTKQRVVKELLTGSASDQRSTGQAARQCEGTGGRGVRRWDTTALQEHSGPYNSHKGQR